MKTKPVLTSFALLIISSAFSSAAAQGTVFTYQGQLTDCGSPASGLYDFRFSVMESPDLGVPLDLRITNGLLVNNGLFTVMLDFGSELFDGSPRWLEIEVKTNNAAGPYALLSPRQELTATPYAILAGSIGGPLPNAGLSGTYNNPVTLENEANLFGGAFTGNGGGLTNVNADTLEGLGAASFWRVNGNPYTSPGLHFLGTIDNQPLELRVNNTPALRLQPTTGAPNVIGGAEDNVVGEGVTGATIGGGTGNAVGDHNTASGIKSFVGGGDYNIAEGWNAAIGGGFTNRASGIEATIGGGFGNSVNGDLATVGGGRANVADGPGAVVGGGGWNGTWVGGNTASGPASTVAGGLANTASYLGATVSGGGGNTASGYSATVGGGVANTAHGDCASVGGGRENMATNEYATVSGGTENVASGSYATIGGGRTNTASDYGTTVAGGMFNTAYYGAAVGGGANNTADGWYGSIGGGSWNTASGWNATVAGGFHNTALGYAAVGGGWTNTATGGYATIGGGHDNLATDDYATVGGGTHNVATGSEATVGGGSSNSATNGSATVPGGNKNAAGGRYSFAAGRRAKALHDGAFVWADARDLDYFSTTTNEFSIRAEGGVRIDSRLGIKLNDIDRPLITRGWFPFTSGAYEGVGRFGLFMEPWTLTAGLPTHAATGFQIVSYNQDSTINTVLMSVNQSGVVTADTFNPTSDRAAKEHFDPVDPLMILEQVASLPITRWNFKRDLGTRHLGPVAQDFHAAFGLGTDDKHIATVDADGVALTAIQGLNQKLEDQVRQKNAEIGELKRELGDLKQLVNSLISTRIGGEQ